MSFTDNSLPSIESAYQRQMTSFRRTRSAILEGAKSLVVLHGVSQTSMIEISAAAEVSRATLYNHFRDKGSIFRALLESELERVFLKASSNPTLTEALATLSREISADPALATMRTMDPALLTTLCSDTEDPLWEKVRNELISISRDSEFGEMVIRWLVGQVFHPLSLDQSVKQSSLLTSR